MENQSHQIESSDIKMIESNLSIARVVINRSKNHQIIELPKIEKGSSLVTFRTNPLEKETMASLKLNLSKQWLKRRASEASSKRLVALAQPKWFPREAGEVLSLYDNIRQKIRRRNNRINANATYTLKGSSITYNSTIS